MANKEQSDQITKEKVSDEGKKSGSSKEAEAKTPPADETQLPVTTTTALTTPTEIELQQKAQDAIEKAKTGDINAFTAISLTLNSMRLGLEVSTKENLPPRWIRMIRIKEDGIPTASERPIGFAVYEVLGGFLFAMGIVHELALKAIDLLTDIDCGKALVEVGADMLETLSSDEVARSLQYAVGARKPEDDQEPNKKDLSNPLRPVGEAIRTAKKVLDYIPAPEDVHGVAYELYKMLAVAHKSVAPAEVPEETAKLPVHVDLNNTGKLRLMSWALEKPIPVFLGDGLLDFTATNIQCLGSRIIDNVATPSKNTPEMGVSFKWGTGDEGDKLAVYQYAYAGLEKDDFADVDGVLTALGYKQSNLTKRLISFQEINELGNDGGATDGSLDIHTISRLMNLDYKHETLCRAKKYKAATTTKK